VFHPVLVQNGDLSFVWQKMLENHDQISAYISLYCHKHFSPWCREQQAF
jgi:hypothetical protein